MIFLMFCDVLADLHNILFDIFRTNILNSPKSNVIEKSPKNSLTFIWYHVNIMVTNLTVVTFRTIDRKKVMLWNMDIAGLAHLNKI